MTGSECDEVITFNFVNKVIVLAVQVSSLPLLRQMQGMDHTGSLNAHGKLLHA